MAAHGEGSPFQVTRPLPVSQQCRSLAVSPPDRVTRCRVRGPGAEGVRQAEGRARLGRMHAFSFKKTPHCYCGGAMLVMTAVTREDRHRMCQTENREQVKHCGGFRLTRGCQVLSMMCPLWVSTECLG